MEVTEETLVWGLPFDRQKQMQNEESCYKYKNKQEIKMIRNREKQVTHCKTKETIKGSLLLSLLLIYFGAFKPLLILPLTQF